MPTAGICCVIGARCPTSTTGRRPRTNPIELTYGDLVVGQLGFAIDDNIWWDQLAGDYVVFWPDLPPAE